MPRGHKFSIPTRKRRIVYQDPHPDCRRIDIDKLQRRADLLVGQRFANVNFLEASETNDFARARVFSLNLLKSLVSEECRDRRAFATTVSMNANDRIADADAPTYYPAQRDTAEVIAIMEIRNQHLKERLERNGRWRHMLHDCLKEWRHVLAVFVQLAQGETVFGAGVNDREVELLVGGLELDKKIENHVEHLVWARIFPVDLIDDDDWLQPIFHGLAQNEAGLGLGTIVRIDNQKDAVHHLHDAFDFAAEIGMARCVHDVDPVTVPVKGCVLGANRNSLFALQIHRIHDAFGQFLIGSKRARLPQQLIDKRSLAVINVRDDGNVANLVHGFSLELQSRRFALPK